MAKDGYAVLDSDLHVVEPPDLWERYIDAPFKNRAPRGIGVWVVEVEGKLMPGGVAHAGTATSASARRDRERFRTINERGWSPEAQLDAMDAEGIDVGVMYPTRGLFVQSIDGMEPKLAAAIARAYNDWLYDFCATNPQRLVGAGMISPFDVDEAVTEARRAVKELGFKAIFLRPNPVNGRNWHDAYYDPLWSELESLNVSLGFHEGLGGHLPQVGDRFGKNVMLRHTVCHPLEQMLAAVSFCGGGILERHPRLRVGFLEGNASWLPFLLWRMDEHYEWIGDVHARELTLPPSAYFKRQCYVSVECDEEPIKGVFDLMGVDNVVFSTDFPHPDSKFPGAIERFLKLPLPHEAKRAILWDNCARFYALS
jgi:predicted TIM-barrel fold metal-dependent hydrolase